ncbi:MAG: hypothetical protein S0880_09690 [Actinomycetota bacterium]|nr:hypothetical protein [Actinomycetota bacterium]
MTDLDDRLTSAVDDLWWCVEDFDLPATVQRRPAAQPALAFVAATLLVVIVAVGFGSAVRDTPRDMAASTARFQGGVTTATDVAAAPDGRSGPMTMREAHLASTVAAAGRGLGWDVDVPGDVLATTSRAPLPGVTFTEVHLDLGGAAGRLQVSYLRGDADAVAEGTSVERELVEQRGTADIYEGTDGNTARAVELFDGTTIVYVRSEWTSDARSFAELVEIADAVNREHGDRALGG